MKRRDGVVHRPTPAELLGGVHRTLAAEVLPELADGAAQRQLKAALVILRRLEQACERLPAYVDEEAEDVATTLRAVLGRVASTDPAAQTLASRLPDAPEAGAPYDSAGAARRDVDLQALLIEVDALLRAQASPALADLMALYARMVTRQEQAWATVRSA
jgi:hypothetical protein